MICSHCHNEIADDVKCCPECGARIKAPASVTEQPDADAERPASISERPVDDAVASDESPDAASPDATVLSPVPVDKTVAMPRPVSDSGGVSSPFGVGPVEGGSVGDGQAGGCPVAPKSLVDKARDDAALPKKKDPRKVAAIVAGIIAALSVVGGGTWAFLNYRYQQQEAAEQAQKAEEEAIAKTEHAVVIKVSGEGWDTSAGASRLPVHIQGTDSKGGKVDEVQNATSDGHGIDLRQGSYVLSVPASPIAADGTVFDISNTQVEVSFSSKEQQSTEIDATGKGGFELRPVDALEVTDEQIAEAYKYASKDTTEGAPDADVLKAAATKRRDDAVAAKKEADAKAARTVSTADYTLELPSCWDGRVTVQYNTNSVNIFSKAYPTRQICSIIVDTAGAGPMGDIGTAQMGYASLSNGRFVHVWANRYSWIITYANVSGSTDPSDYYTYDEARELVDLQTGGAVYYDDVLAAVKSGENADSYYFSQDTFFQNNIINRIKAK